jgi:hypothetical protein
LQLHAAIIANQCICVEIQDSVKVESRLTVGEPLGSPYFVDSE